MTSLRSYLQLLLGPTQRKKRVLKTILLLLLRALFNGLQWVGWSWAVLISQHVVVSILGWETMRNVIVSLSIALNEIIWSQIFGRITLKVDRYMFKRMDDDDIQQQQRSREEMNSIYKNMMACVASGIVFDFVDRAVAGSIDSYSFYYRMAGGDVDGISLLMRCIWVFGADRLVFHVVMEILDRIESGNWSFSNEISIIEGASSAGMSAIAYNLSTELGIYICKEHFGTDNEWLIGLFCSPLIALATGVGFLVGWMESKLWEALDENLFRICSSRLIRKGLGIEDHSGNSAVASTSIPPPPLELTTHHQDQ